jgi:hypothetical protein
MALSFYSTRAVRAHCASVVAEGSDEEQLRCQVDLAAGTCITTILSVSFLSFESSLCLVSAPLVINCNCSSQWCSGRGLFKCDHIRRSFRICDLAFGESLLEFRRLSSGSGCEVIQGRATDLCGWRMTIGDRHRRSCHRGHHHHQHHHERCFCLVMASAVVNITVVIVRPSWSACRRLSFHCRCQSKSQPLPIIELITVMGHCYCRCLEHLEVASGEDRLSQTHQTWPRCCYVGEGQAQGEAKKRLGPSIEARAGEIV